MCQEISKLEVGVVDGESICSGKVPVQYPPQARNPMPRGSPFKKRGSVINGERERETAGVSWGL